MRRVFEPVAWLLFSAGGVAAAVLLPVLIVLFGLALPLGLMAAPTHGELLAFLSNPLSRLVLLGLSVLGFFHWGHRFRKTVEDGLKLKRFELAIAVVCYGLALVGSLLAAYLLLVAL